MHSTFTPSARIVASRRGRVEALVLQQRGRAAEPRRDEASCGPTSTSPAPPSTTPARPAARPSTRVACSVLPGDVTLAVRHQLGLAARAGGEQHERRVERLEFGERRRRPAAGQQRLVRDRAAPGTPVRAASTTARLRASHTTSAGRARSQPQRDVLGPQLLAARQRRRAEPQPGQDREHVLDACCRRGSAPRRPRRTPRSADTRRPASRSAASSSPNVHSRRVPSAARVTTREFVGRAAAATTSRTQFTRRWSSAWTCMFVVMN